MAGLGSKSFRQKIDYRYNIRGWLTTINDPDNLSIRKDLFGMRLFYENNSGFPMGGFKSNYNGNISGVTWNNMQLSNSILSSQEKRAYNYAYDKLNRLLKADYGNASSNWNTYAFDVTGISSGIDYDKSGNIKRLKEIT
jgi:hypothetical protein